MPSDELWALRITADAAEVWTENGSIVAQFKRTEDAQETIDNHNWEIELNAPEAPAAVKSAEEKMAASIAYYRQNEPDGARLLSMIQEGAARTLKLLALQAPEIIIAESCRTLEKRIATFGALHPGTMEEIAAEAMRSLREEPDHA
jgi:hypothetical protein